MKSLIAYATKYGCTEKCARMLSEKLDGIVDLCNLKAEKVTDLSQYDKIIIGGSVYVGKIRKEASEFCTNNLELLKGKKVGLFLCATQSSDVIETEFNTSFPQELLKSAEARECFGGEYSFKKMNFLERFIVKKIAKTDKDMSTLSNESIDMFAQIMNKA